MGVGGPWGVPVRRRIRPLSLEGGGRTGGVDVRVVGRGHRPGGDEQRPPHHNVDPDEQSDDDRERTVDRVARGLADQPGPHDLEDLQPDSAEDCAAHRPAPVGLLRQPPEQVEKDRGVNPKGDEQGQDAGDPGGGRTSGQPDPVQERPGRRGRQAGDHERGQQGKPEAGEDGDVAQPPLDDVADVDVLVPDHPQRVTQRVDPGEAGE